MLLIFVQEVFLFLAVKSVLRELRAIGSFDVIFLISFSVIAYVSYGSLGAYFSLLGITLFTFLTWWYTRRLSEALCIVLQVFIWAIILDHISSLMSEVMPFADVYLIIFISLASLSLVLLNLVLMKTNFKPVFESPRLNRIMVLLLSIIYAYIMLSEGLENKSGMLLRNLVVLLVVVGLVLVLYIVYIKNVKAHYEVQQQKAQIKNDTRYMNEVEAHYNELRRFRHDYQNMMLSLNEYLKTDDLDGLRTYYQQNIAPITARVSKEKYRLEDLSRVKVKSVKSILFSKLSYAQSQGIDVRFDLTEPFEKVTVNELDLDIALGIMLDNAIEATSGHEQGKIMSAIFMEKTSTVFVIQNTVFDPLPPLWQLKETGYSTKGENRGIGLTNLSEIVSRNENMILETRLPGSVFIQRLTMKRGVSND